MSMFTVYNILNIIDFGKQRNIDVSAFDRGMSMEA